MSGTIKIYKNNWDKERIIHDEKLIIPIKPDRYSDNLKILEALTKFLMDNPNIRFGQALWILGILDDDKDSFYEEPESMLHRIGITKI